ncbi:MAG: hypothetical protein ACNS61_14405 [Candidatus Wenzhouxiangella sp. M2_3B_020]
MDVSGPGHPRPLAATLLVGAFLLLPSMASIGMFLDGLIYASVSRNLAAGEGSMWALHFSDGLFPVFREHPPLVFWLQSAFFRVLGDSYLTERAYDLAVVVVTALLVRALWIRAVRAAGHTRLADYWWLALLCWVLVPKWSWAYRSNVLENTMTLFCVASVLLAFLALRARGAVRAAGWAAGAAVATLLAFLAKGLPALFVLVAPLCLAPALRGITVGRIALVFCLHLVASALLLALLLFLEPEAATMLGEWWRKQVATRTGLGEGWSILAELSKKLAPMVLVGLVARLAVRRRVDRGWWRPVAGSALSMLLLGLAASAPLVMGDRDSGHYLLPSLPFYALAFGLIASSALDAAGDRMRETLQRRPGRPFTVVAVLGVVVIAAMCVSRIGEIRKNERYHVLFDQVAGRAGEGASIDVEPELYDDWLLHAVGQRYHRISLVGDGSTKWRLVGSSATGPAGGARRIESGPWALERVAPRPDSAE